MSKTKILVGSPVYKTPDILEAFLCSLKRLNHGEYVVDYIFVDDNVEESSSEQLATFCLQSSKVIIIKGNNRSTYECNEESHYWSDSLMHRVAEYKNTMIQYAIDYQYDAIFFVDSDLILHPDLLLHLEGRNKEVVSEIFWSRWHPAYPLEPNVWLFDEYDLVPKHLGEILSKEEMKRRQKEYLEKLRKPGLYEVGGLGACTLIRRSALLKGVNFSPIKNLTIHGEDRFFCIRAAVLGIELYVDTSYPAYHIYRDSDLAGVPNYIKQCETPPCNSKVTLSMVVKNEQKRYLRQVLTSLVGHINEAVIIDDASTDDTILICEEILGDIPLHIIKNQQSMFSNEVSLRKLQWEETVKTNPEWILNLDADELIEESFWENAKTYLGNPDLEQCCFRLFDMWNKTHYREDELWSAHKQGSTFLLRYRPDFQYQWKDTPQHCGRFPLKYGLFSKADTEYRIQHLGWAKREDRIAKYQRYQELDPGGVYGNHAQYESILDPTPKLIEWRSI